MQTTNAMDPEGSAGATEAGEPRVVYRKLAKLVYRPTATNADLRRAHGHVSHVDPPHREHLPHDEREPHAPGSHSPQLGRMKDMPRQQ